MRNKEQLKARNEKIRKHVATLFKKYPHWNYDYIMQKTAETFFLSKRTIEAIIKGEGTYNY
jgi:Uri superfamily endonuclease